MQILLAVAESYLTFLFLFLDYCFSVILAYVNRYRIFFYQSVVGDIQSLVAFKELSACVTRFSVKMEASAQGMSPTTQPSTQPLVFFPLFCTQAFHSLFIFTSLLYSQFFEELHPPRVECLRCDWCTSCSRFFRLYDTFKRRVRIETTEMRTSSASLSFSASSLLRRSTLVLTTVDNCSRS